MNRAIWLGVDVGTGGVRALAVRDDDGSVLGRGERPLTSRRAGARHEQDPHDWCEAFGGACRDALDGVDSGAVRGVATCATSGTIVLVDADDGVPLTPGLMYDDGRATTRATARARHGADGAGSPAQERVGDSGAPPSWAVAKLDWLLAHHPDLARAGVRVAHQPDVITRRLAGRAVATDSSHALKTGYDLVAEAWPPALQDRLPAGMLPDVVRPGTILGCVCAGAAAHTGLREGTPIVAGMTDGCAAQIAAGALREGDWSSVLGTTLVLKGVSPAPIGDPPRGLYSHRAPDGEWLPGGASSCGAGVLASTFPGRDLDELTRAAARHEDTRVLAYPLAGRGERFPFLAADAEAFVLGAPADDGELFAALLHGLAFVERLCFDVLERQLGAATGGEITLSGGAARNRALCQLRADVLGRPVRLPEHTESAFGMAILAVSACQGRRLADVAAQMVRTRERFEPRPARTALLTPRYEEFVGELRRRTWLAEI